MPYKVNRFHIFGILDFIMTVLWHVAVRCLVLTKPVYYDHDFLIGGSKVSRERKCLFLIYTVTGGLVAALRAG